MKNIFYPYAILSIVITLFISACNNSNSGNSGDSTNVLPDPELPELSLASFIDAVNLGGETTESSGLAARVNFDIPAVNLKGAALDRHISGDVEFERVFTKAPSAIHPDIDGVGPVFNNDACIQCHNADGRGNYSSTALQAGPTTWTKMGANEALFLRISVEPDESCVPTPGNCYCAPKDVPGFSSQLFHRGVFGARPDSPFAGQSDFYVKFAESTVTYGDGETVTLYKPEFEIRNPYDNPGEKPGDNTPPISRLLQADVKTSPRMGMPVFGLGLLEAITEKNILALADPEDKDGDGISGRPNWVCDPVKKNMNSDPDPKSLGRFGWKASTPSVAVQGSGAYRGDMGVTNYFFPDESIVGTALHTTYLTSNPGDDGQSGREVADDIVQDVMFYSNTLAVPARRNVNNAQVRKGAELFHTAKCSTCHRAEFTTGKHPGILGADGHIAVEIPEVSNQIIFPFTDMLLHDMGERLADNRTDFSATGREWKTRPLWGVGMTQVVNPLAGFLHDSRARSLEEAILWHGGEAEEPKETFRTMTKADRDALLAFLNSL